MTVMHAVVERRFDPLLDRMRWAVGEGYAVWFVVLGLATYATLNSDGFLTSKNIENYLGQVPVLVIAPIGMLIAVLAGDRPVGRAVAKLSAVLISGIADGDFGKFVVAVSLAYLIGATVGAVNAPHRPLPDRAVHRHTGNVLDPRGFCLGLYGARSQRAGVGRDGAYEAIGPFPYGSRRDARSWY